jgi:AcrR family transcriptional regulator
MLKPKILAAAEQLFIERGYHGLAMREIAEVVGVSKAALYYHFRDKEELFLAILDSYLDEVEDLIDRASAGAESARDRIHRVVSGLLGQPVEQRAVIRLASQEMAHLSAPARLAFSQTYHTRFIGKIEAILRQGVDAGELHKVDTSVATWVLLGMMYPYFYPAYMQDVPPTANVVEQIVEIFLDGLAV